MECRIINSIRCTVHSVPIGKMAASRYNYYKIYRLRMEAEFTVIIIGIYVMYAKKLHSNSLETNDLSAQRIF